MPALDLDQVSAFVLVADLSSFTRAAEATGTTQSAISLKLKRLEQRLGRRLLERTPRLVRLSAEGAAFLDRARDLLAAHDRALDESCETRRLALGISDHVAGSELPDLIARINGQDRALLLEVRMGFSRDLIDAYDRGELDAVIVRREGQRRDGETLRKDRMGWFARADYQHRAREPLRLATLASSCGVRAAATRALDKARMPWVEVFVGGGIAAVAAAVVSGLGVAPLAQRIAPPGTIDVGPALGLPELPLSEVVLHSRASDPRLARALRGLAATFKATGR